METGEKAYGQKQVGRGQPCSVPSSSKSTVSEGENTSLQTGLFLIHC